MKVNFFDQPYLLRVIDIIRHHGNMRRYKALDFLGKKAVSEGTVIAVGRIIKYHDWDQSYEVSPWM